VGIERDDNAVLGTDARGVPKCVTNMSHVRQDSEFPPAPVYVPCGPAYSHSAPSNPSPYHNPNQEIQES
jgi:hypothetical protein